MLVPIHKDVIADYWDILSPGVEESYLPMDKTTFRVLNGILKSLLIGDLTCWLKIENEVTLYFLIVGITEDIVLNVNVATVYSFYSFKTLNVRQAREATNDVKVMAAQLCCGRVLSFTNNERLAMIYKKYGWEVDTKLLILEV